MDDKIMTRFGPPTARICIMSQNGQVERVKDSSKSRCGDLGHYELFIHFHFRGRKIEPVGRRSDARCNITS